MPAEQAREERIDAPFTIDLTVKYRGITVWQYKNLMLSDYRHEDFQFTLAHPKLGGRSYTYRLDFNPGHRGAHLRLDRLNGPTFVREWYHAFRLSPRPYRLKQLTVPNDPFWTCWMRLVK